MPIAPAIVGAGIGAASNLIGGALQLGAQNQANKTSERVASEQMNFQRDAIQQGIRWRVNDAKKAGIHPLYALGANIPTYAPVSTAFGTPNFDFVGRAGQDLGRAAQAAMTPEMKQTEYQVEFQKKSLQRIDLENAILAARLLNMNSPGTGPGTPSVVAKDPWSKMGAGLTATGVIDEPMRRTGSPKGAPWSEPGTVADMGFARTRTGWAPVRSKDHTERLEDDWIGNTLWSMRNRLYPSLGMNNNHPPFKPKPGHKWDWSTIHQEWRQVPIKISKRYHHGGGAW